MLAELGRFLRNIRKRYRSIVGYKPRDKVIVQLYRGYRSTEKLFVQGRVLEDEQIIVHKDDRRLKNIRNAIRRFESDEVVGAKVKIKYLGEHFELYSDDEGYLELYRDIQLKATDDPWEPVTAQILEIPFGENPTTVFDGEIADLSKEAKYAIVSDIDDTILMTNVTSLFKWRAVYKTFVYNAHTRFSFSGARELYEELAKGPGEESENNPIFYLSRSPWNLYDMIVDFLDFQGFPKGPIFLRDVGLPFRKQASEFGHKEGNILRLIEDVPTLKFVLIGDSGEKDADIYVSVAKKYPDRIAAIIIRNVKANSNARRIEKLFSASQKHEHWYLVKDSREAADKLASLGLLNIEQVESIRLSASEI